MLPWYSIRKYSTIDYIPFLNNFHLPQIEIIISTSTFFRKQGAAPVFKSLVLGRPVVAKVLVERIPLEAVPEDPEEASKWLHQNYVHKVSF